jgi:hypothetical protein
VPITNLVRAMAFNDQMSKGLKIGVDNVENNNDDEESKESHNTSYMTSQGLQEWNMLKTTMTTKKVKKSTIHKNQ